MRTPDISRADDPADAPRGAAGDGASEGAPGGGMLGNRLQEMGGVFPSVVGALRAQMETAPAGGEPAAAGAKHEDAEADAGSQGSSTAAPGRAGPPDPGPRGRAAT